MSIKVLNLRQSSNIKGATWDSDTLQLNVEFFNGGSYSYDQVPEAKVIEFENADSPGRYLHANLKGAHQHSKIG